MGTEEDRRIAQSLYPRLENPEEARIVLAKYHKAKPDEEVPMTTEVYEALSRLAFVRSGNNRTVNPKERDRRKGQRMRKARTGSRRG